MKRVPGSFYILHTVPDGFWSSLLQKPCFQVCNAERYMKWSDIHKHFRFDTKAKKSVFRYKSL